MNRFCNTASVEIIPYSPLYRGHLARPAGEFGKSLWSAEEKAAWQGAHGTVEPDVSIIKRLQEIASKRN
jgi:aryl-alcohol dehydrogenase-like predicted oxidoreductase